MATIITESMQNIADTPAWLTVKTRSSILPQYASTAAFIAAKGIAAAEDDTFYDTTYNVVATYRKGVWVIGTIFKNKTFTVGGSGDFTTLAQLADYINYVGLLDENSTIIADVDAGTYAENVEITNLLGRLIIRGDQRTVFGYGFAHRANPLPRTNSGSGLITLANSGNNITVTRAGSNPNFSTAIAGDTLLIMDKTGTAGIHTVASVASNVITLTGTAPNIDGLGAGFCLIPNRVVTSIANKSRGNLIIQGFHCNTFYQGNPALEVFPNQHGGTLEIDNCFLYLGKIYCSVGIVKIGSALTDNGLPGGSGATSGFNTECLAFNSGAIEANGYCALGSSTSSFQTAMGSRNGGKLLLFGSSLVSCTQPSVKLDYAGELKASYCFILGNYNPSVSAVYGADAFMQGCVIEYAGTPLYNGVVANGGDVKMVACTVKVCDIGLYALNGGKINFLSGVFASNNTNASPATSGALGNNGGLISII